MSNDAVAATAGNSLIHRITEGVGIVRERTIEIGARVIWVDNIGSLVILHGQRNYAMAIVGGLLLLAGLLIVSDDTGMGLLLIVAGGGLIAWNLSQPINNGLSIGTVDGRSTLIVSDNHDFLNAALDLIRDKIESGSITLQGTFDIGSTHVNTGGGGVAIGRGAEAVARGGQIERPAPADSFAPVDSAPAPYVAPEPRETATPAAAEYSRPSYADTDYNTESSGGGSRTVVFVVAAFLAVAVLGGGGYYWWSQDQAAQAAEAEWNAVPKQDVSALRQYLAGDPGNYRDDAEAALVQLETDRYNVARANDTIEALNAFVTDFPESNNVLAARGRIAELESIAEAAAAQAAMELANATAPYFGYWRGRMQQGARSYELIAVFEQDKDNRLRASIEYIQLRCSGAWEGEPGSAIATGPRRARELIRDGRRRCVDGIIELTRLTDGGASVAFYHPDGRAGGVTGVIYPVESEAESH